MSSAENKRDSILFIDDEIVCHSLVELVVGNFTDYKLITALNGKDAIELAKSNSEKLFLILSDIMLPDVKGYEIFKTLKEEPTLSDIPFLFQSGLASHEAELKKHIDQEVKVIDKPYKQDELLEVIEQAAQDYSRA